MVPFGLSPSAWWVVILGLALILQAQAPGTSTADVLVHAIEARGAQHVARLVPEEIHPSFGSRPFTRGTPERRCVEASNGRARSGEWELDPFGYAATWRPDAEGKKTAWLPLHQDGTQPGPIYMTVQHLSPPFRTYDFSFPGAVYGDAPDGRRWFFYAIGNLILPDLGEWAIEVTQGANWGCFLMTLDQVAPAQVEPDPR